MSDVSPILDAEFIFDAQTQRAAYDRMRPKFEAILSSQTMRITCDVKTAVGLGILVAGRLPSLQAHIDRLAFYLDVDAIADLGNAALALGESQADFVFATTPQLGMTELRAAAAKLIDLLLLSAMALSQQGLLPNEHVELVRSSAGYKDAYEHLSALVKLFRDHWPSIVNKTGITQEQLDQAATLALKLLHGATLREHSKLSPSEATLQRERAFTLFVRTYQQVRRLVEFVYPDAQEAERIVPTLWPRSGRKKGDESVETPVADAPPASDAITPFGSTPEVPVGHRGGTPWVSNASGS